jgi:signal transduction histidine kinase
VRAVFDQQKPARFSIPWVASKAGDVDFEEGRDLWIDASLFPIMDSEGNISSVVCQWVDITARRQAEEALQAYSDRLEEMVTERTRALEQAQERLIRQERLAVLGQLSGSIAHELRSPLGAIKNATYLLNLLLENHDSDLREILDILDRQILTSEQIINNLLEFARTRQSQKQLVDINQVINQALARIDVPDDVILQQDLADLPPISADSAQVGQILGNLILNAIQAMPAGGHLTLKTCLPQPAWVTVSIADTGVGIPPENRERIFEPMFTTRPKGIGLGLALVRMLLEAHGGTIRVESAVGQGSTFTVELPMDGQGDDHDTHKL